MTALQRFVVEEGDWEIVNRVVQKHGTHDQSSHNPHKGGRGSGGSQTAPHPTQKTNPELLTPLKDYIVQYPDGFGHEAINGRLRERGDVLYTNLTPEAQKELDEAIGSLDKLVELSPALTEDTTTFRGINSNFARDLEERGVGATFTDNGFTSVSLDRDIAAGFPSRPTGNVMEIVVPEGTKAIIPSKFFTSSTVKGTELKREKELILGRGTDFEILSIEESPYRVGKLFRIKVKQ